MCILTQGRIISWSSSQIQFPAPREALLLGALWGGMLLNVVCFHAAASFVWGLRKSIVQADTLRKEASLSAGASAAAAPLKGLNEALLSEAAGLNSDTKLLGNFEEQQQLKTQLHYINYAFMPLLGGLSAAAL